MVKQIKTIKQIFGPTLRKLEQLSENAGEIFLSPEGEQVLIDILEAETKLEEIKERAKLKLAEAALAVNPNFSSIQADNVKVYYREYGAKYYLDESQKDLVPAGIVTEKISYSIDSKAVEQFVKEKNGMPAGIKEVERTKTLSFSLKTNGKTNE